MNPQLSRFAFLLVPSVLAVLYWSSSRPAGEPETVKQQPANHHAHTYHARPQALPRQPDPRYTLAQQVDRLAATGRAADAYDAYWLVQTCIDFQRTGDLAVPDGDLMRRANDAEKSAEKLMCADLTGRMKTARLDHLAVAAKAGISGADLAFLQTGPFGDISALESRPDDPLVLAWKEEALGYLEAQALQGSIASMIALVGKYNEDGELVKRHPVSALRYATAVHDYFETLLGGASKTSPNPLSDDFMRRMSQGLSSEQVKLATAEGRRLTALAAESQH